MDYDRDVCIFKPILVSYAAKGLLPYRGLGSGIKLALEDWPDISFTDDRDGLLADFCGQT
jgi:ATP-dependent DNA helicase RecG